MKRFLFLLVVASIMQACGSNYFISYIKTDKALKILCDDGELTLTPQSDNAVRVQFTQSSSKNMDELIFVETVATPEFTVERSGRCLSLKTAKMTVEVDYYDKSLTFKDANGRVILREQSGGRRMTPSTIQGDSVFVVEQRFLSPEDECLYGLGQFQDGYLNIRGLPRQLRQVNTQICIPLMLSNKGYGLLWHNYGLIDFNPADSALTLHPMDTAFLRRHEAATRPTVSKDAANYVFPFYGFTAEFNAPISGRYALVLDIIGSGQKGCIIVDGTTVFDSNNPWQPPRMPVIVELKKGQHQIGIITEQHCQHPNLFWKKLDDKTVFRSPVAQAIDYTVFAGYGDEVISSFRTLAGNTPLMPLWALGYIHCRERFHSQAELLENAHAFRERKLPADLFVQDWQYWGKYGWNAMKFDEADYPDPKGMVDELHNMNIRLMLSVWSRDFGEMKQEYRDKGYLLPRTDWLDFFNPEAAEFYWSNIREKLVKPYGIDAWWLDATEPESEPLQRRRVNAGKVAAEVYRNVYPLFVSKTVYEGYRRDVGDKRTMILTRSGFSGMQRYAVSTWSGDVGADWATFRRQITGGLGQMSAGLSWWTYDAGGFFRPENQYADTAYHQCFLRWFQAATFVPLQRVHGFGTQTEFWHFGETVERISRKYLELRYRLLPYIYSQAAAITFKGSTLMRPLVFDFANDRKALEQQYEFMFGPAILVAPVVEPDVSQWKVYLPENKGGWINFWTGEKVKGGTTVTEPVSIEKIPLFVRAGSIVPLSPKSEYTGQHRDAAWEIRIYAGADGKFTVYEDEGDNYNYEKGQYATWTLTWDDAAQTLVIGERQGKFDGMTAARTLNIVKIAPQTGGIDEATPQQTVEYTGKKITLKLN
jgi:alpha-D-xyloside xylohydrolase